MTVAELPVDFTDARDPVWDKRLEAYLRRFPPARSQYRTPRRGPLWPQIVLHTAESGTDMAGPDPKAEAVARFIGGRVDGPGSYHLVGDADSVIQLVRFSDEAFHDGTGSNRHTIGISLAVDAADWPKMSPRRRGQLINTAAHMSAYAGRWLVDHGAGPAAPRPRLLTRAESEAGESGFISHARRDPSRRYDPGPHFPWGAFFARYEAVAVEGPYWLGVEPGQRPGETKAAPDPWERYVEEAQGLLGVTVDGDFGPATLAALEARVETGDIALGKLHQIDQIINH